MKSIHFKLFSRYALLIIIITAIFMVIVYEIWGKTLRTNATGELQADCDNLTTLLDTQLDQMDQLSKRIVSSQQLKNLFTENLYTYDAEAHNNRQAFSNSLFDIIKLSFNNMELNMFDTSGHYINVGMTSNFQLIQPQSIKELPWLNMVFSAYGKKIILSPDSPHLNTVPEPVISLCRSFATNIPQNETAILEIQLKYSVLDKKIMTSIHNASDKKNIYIYDEYGSLIYPYQVKIPEERAAFMTQLILSGEAKISSSAPNIARIKKDRPVLISYKYSDFSGWTVFVAESEYDLFASFRKFQAALFFAVILFIIITLFITYRIASSLSAPLLQLEQIAASLTLDNLGSRTLPEYKSKFQELDSLYHSFDQMQNKLQLSLDDVVAARTLAIEAKMMALQSQMNPHFLYNTLSTISILAEEQEDAKIIKMCADLSLLLRYISSGTSRSVTLEQEIAHTVSYINLIKVKYEERIQFQIQVDDTLLQVQVPKLIVQPLVENSVKYGLEVNPPWKISILGYISENKWYIQVRDNGSGFTPKYLEYFRQQVNSITAESILPDLSINGMGLMNLYTRLWLLYKESMQFSIGNHPKGGAQVTIGGPIVLQERKET